MTCLSFQNIHELFTSLSIEKSKAHFETETVGDIDVVRSAIPSRRTNHMFIDSSHNLSENFDRASSYFQSNPSLIWVWSLNGQINTLDQFLSLKKRYRLLDGTCFVYDLEQNPIPETDKSIKVSIVESEEELNWWYRGQDICFNWDNPDMRKYAEVLFLKGKLLLAHTNGEVLGQSMLYLGKEAAGNYYSSVLPLHRKKGVATAMTLKRMEMAREHGKKMIVTQCLETSAGIYRRMGFTQTGVFTLFT